MRSITVQIPRPCHERWTEMQTNDKGRFCASCQKTVVDYSALSDRELVRQLSQISSADDICRRLGADQLDRPLVIPDPVTTHWQQWLRVLTIGLMGWQTAQAQSNQALTPTRATTIQPLKPLSIREVVPEDTNQVIVSGRVLIADSTDAVSCLPNAMVHIMMADPLTANRFRFKAGQTDGTGIFRIVVPVGWSMEKLTINVTSGDFQVRGVHPVVISATPSITISDIILTESARTKHLSVSGGGLVVIKSPSRWERIKQKLSRKNR